MADQSHRKIITIAGATGVVGRHLVAAAQQHGYQIRILTRSTGNSDLADARPFIWDPASGRVQDSTIQALDGSDIIVNLAGASLAEGRLTESRKQRILQSRLDATNALIAAHRQCQNPPSVWVQASAIGYYGDCGDESVTEQHPAAANWFLADVCQQWERAAARVLDTSQRPFRLIIARIGLVLADDAPAWRAMLLPIKLGVGGALGDGKQWYAWIDAGDLADALLYLATKPDASGVYNLTAPEPVRQADLARKAAQRLRRPSLLPAPAFMLRAVLGEAADALLLASCKALPNNLLAENFPYKYATVDEELTHLLR